MISITQSACTRVRSAGREWQEAAEVGRDQVTHSSACQAIKPEFDPEGPPPLTGAQESGGIPTCDILHEHIQDLDS